MKLRFRAWDRSFKRYRHVDGVYPYQKEGHTEGGEVFLDDNKTSHYFPEDIVLEAWTGLVDKYGIPVYEGDIVKCSRGCPHAVVWMGAVPSSAIMGGMPGFYLSGLNGGYSWVGNESNKYGEEIVGNIHQNPELLRHENTAQKTDDK